MGDVLVESTEEGVELVCGASGGEHEHERRNSKQDITLATPLLMTHIPLKRPQN